MTPFEALISMYIGAWVAGFAVGFKYRVIKQASEAI